MTCKMSHNASELEVTEVIHNFADYKDVIEQLRSEPAEHELENLNKRITEALEALH